MKKTELNELIESALMAKGWKSPYIPIKNCASGTRYSGINTLLLPVEMERRGQGVPMFATYNQAKAKGWQVKKGAKAYHVVYWNFIEAKAKAGGTQDETKAEKIPFLKTFAVFNVEDIDGVDVPKDGADFTALQAENAKSIEAYLSGQNIEVRKEVSNSAYYSPARDYICMPTNLIQGDYTYNATLAHEAAHSTGHEKRLKRFTAENSHFASKEYSVEELTAEFTAYMLGFNNPDSCLAYIGSWLKALQASDRLKEAARAWTSAVKANDFILTGGAGLAGAK